MYSITAPTKKVFFSQTTAFWPAFYYMMHAWDDTVMKQERLRPVLERLSEIFEMPLAHYRKNSKKGGAVDKLSFGRTELLQALVPAKGISAIDDNNV